MVRRIVLACVLSVAAVFPGAGRRRQIPRSRRLFCKTTNCSRTSRISRSRFTLPAVSRSRGWTSTWSRRRRSRHGTTRGPYFHEFGSGLEHGLSRQLFRPHRFRKPSGRATWWVLTDSGSVPADGPLATVTVDTTGLFASDPVHSWSLSMENTANGPLEFINTGGGLPANITDGTITLVVPEPRTVLLSVAGAAGLAGYVSLRRRKKRSLPSLSVAEEGPHSSDEGGTILVFPPRTAEAARCVA